MDATKVLELDNLAVKVITPHGLLTAVRGVTLSVAKGEIHGIVGESGCGKSMTMKSVLRLHEEDRTLYTGRILVDKKSVLDMNKKDVDGYRGSDATMIFQNPLNSLNPIMKAGDQIAELLRDKKKMSKQAAHDKVIEMFQKIGVVPAEKRYHQYPFEMSGGLIQRVVIAMALICNPQLIIADEPTTALDVTIQAQILQLIKEIRDEFGTSIVFITHDLGIVAEICDHVSVMYAGRVVESGTVLDIFDHPGHPYTKALIESNRKEMSVEGRLPVIAGAPPSLMDEIIGCSFCERCPRATELCSQKKPQIHHFSENHFSECHFADKVFEESVNNTTVRGDMV